MKPGRALNRRAGENTFVGNPRGQHTAHSTYIPDDHWVECQRCGKDVRSSNTRIDGYSKLIVCTKCFDPKHPQDFVRPKADKIAAEGNVNVASTPTGGVDIEGNSTNWTAGGAEGSTEVPTSTYDQTDPIGS